MDAWNCRHVQFHELMYMLCALKVLHICCLNLMFGSALSPPRLLQCNETWNEYIRVCDHTDPWFRACLPGILRQLYPARKLTDIGVAEAL